MITVSELSEITGTAPHVVRYYTRIGLLNAKRNRGNGYRLFNKHAIARLKFIRQAKLLGYSLKEIKLILSDAKRGHSPCPRVRNIIGQRIKEKRQELEDMLALQKRIERAFTQWNQMPDGMPTGDSICNLIESTEY